ncbi:hypothetical protein SprV_0702363700 [Sparganum proliferum]
MKFYLRAERKPWAISASSLCLFRLFIDRPFTAAVKPPQEGSAIAIPSSSNHTYLAVGYVLDCVRVLS